MDADTLIDKLKIWLTPGNQANTEPAYFRDKVFPLVSDIVETLTRQQKEIARMSQDTDQIAKTHRAERDNLRARAEMFEGENRKLKVQLAERQPEIDRLKSVMAKAKMALQNGE